jgi:hypothetical protein
VGERLSLEIKEIFARLRYSKGKAILAIGGDQILLSLKTKDCTAHFTKEHVLLLKIN